ncbi:MAG: flagellar filament capping protein FliD [Gammaproteobacteria bacterium]
MATISAAGIGSGLDVNGIVTQLMAVERQPLQAMAAQETAYKAKLSAYGSFKSALSSFQDGMRALSSSAKFQVFSATSADTSVYTASSSANSAPGSYSVEVKQLAQAQKIVSKGFTNVTDTVGTGTLTIQFGTFSGGTFTANSDKAAQTITIDSARSSLGGVRDAINAANIGVSASILNDGSGNKLVLTSKDTGAANSIKVTVSDTSDASNTDDAGLSQLAYDPAGTAGNGKNLTQTVAAQNALLKVDGIDNISKSSNTVTDVIQGVTLNLLKQSPTNTPATLTVARDTTAIQSAVEGFVKSYNDINKTIRDLTAYNPATKQGAVLQGDSTTLSVMSQIRRALSAPVAGASGAYTVLSQAGVSFKADGVLALDSAKLQKAMETNFSDIAALFAAQGTPSHSLVSFVSATDKTQPGSYAVSVSQAAAQGYNTGASSAALASTAGSFNTAFTVDANNDTFILKMDGVQSGAITLTQGNYATAAALTAEIQSKINGDAALKAAGVAASVTLDSSSNTLKITSNRYGSASTVELTAVNTNTGTTLGFSVGVGAAGLDVAGTINGFAATGSGRNLTGAAGNAAEGLKLEIIGTATGSRGTISYSQGYAYQLDKLMGKLLDSSGSISSRTDGISSSIKSLDDRRDALNRRLDDIEKRYRDQFTALDSLLGKLRSTSDFLSRQLSATR